MLDAVAILDVGKTNSKLTLWQASRLIARETRTNAVHGDFLDVKGIEAWVEITLRAFAKLARITAIVPVGHGAAAALIVGNQLLAPPRDYEAYADPVEQTAYHAERDAFAETGSPALPHGLNLGFQLHVAERDNQLGPGTQVLLWPQYWAWRLCGVAAAELTSLGCHTDLWCPRKRDFSALAKRRGWASKFPPIRGASEVLGVVTPEWQTRSSLSADCAVHCGLHDSNAALLAARGHPEIGQSDATVLSTGTWFVALRSLDAADAGKDIVLPEGRDCLFNVDVAGRPVPSGRFMGGREAEIIAGLDSRAITVGYDPAALLARLPMLVDAEAMALPSFVSQVGPFPNGKARWLNAPDNAIDKRAVTGLYLALMADALMTLIGSKKSLLIEGRFAEAQVFVRALATLRRDLNVYVANAHDDVPYGALRLLDPTLPPFHPLTPVEPLDLDLSAYVTRWRTGADALEMVA